MKRFAFLLSLPALIFSAGARDAAPEYQYVRQLQLVSAPVRGDVATWQPDADFYAIVEDLRSDWRVFTPDGEEVPFQLLKIATPAFRGDYQACQGTTSARGVSEGLQVVEIELDAPAQELAAVEFSVAERVFERRLSVEVAAADGLWHTAVERRPVVGAPGRDAGQPFRIYFDTPLPGRRVRLNFDAWSHGDAPTPSQPLGVGKVQLFRRSPEAAGALPRLVPRPLPLAEASANTLIFDAGKVPVSRLEIVTGARGFSWNYRLAALEDDGVWMPKKRGTVSCSENGLADLTVDFGESRARRYRLDLDPGEAGLPADLAVSWSGPEYLVVFPTAPWALHMYLGGKTARPVYDLPQATLEAALEGPRYMALKPEANPEWYRLSQPSYRRRYALLLPLGATAAAVCALLGAVMLRLRRRSLPAPDEAG